MSDDLTHLRKLAEAAQNLPGVVVGISVRGGLSAEHWPFVAAANPTAILDLLDRCEAAERERDAYKRAKAENDERYMIERDEARRERDEARAHVLADIQLRVVAAKAAGLPPSDDPPPWDAICETHLSRIARERDEARTAIGAIEYADEEIRRQYGAEFGLLDVDDSPPCWADFAAHIRDLARERDEARAEIDRLHAELAEARALAASPE